jgi:hypothetical protein
MNKNSERSMEKAIAPAKEEKEEIIEKALDEESKTYSDGKSIIIMIAVLAALFSLFLGGSYFYNSFTTAAVVSVDDLHQQNLNNELNEEEGYVYNGYSFVKADGLWWTEMDKFGTLFKVPLHFSPLELEDIIITGSLEQEFNVGEKIFISIDPKVNDAYYALAVSELSFNTAQGIDRVPVGSCIEDHWACENRTIISCDNQQGKPVIELSYGEEIPSVSMQGTCIKLSGLEYGLTKAVDRLLYQWYGIMN